MSTQASPETLDFSVSNHGSIFILTGISPACIEWIESHVGDENTQT